MTTQAYELGLDLDDDDDTIVKHVPGLERCLALASLSAMHSRLAALESQIARTSTRGRKSPWHRARVSAARRLQEQILEAQQRIDSLS